MNVLLVLLAHAGYSLAWVGALCIFFSLAARSRYSHKKGPSR